MTDKATSQETPLQRYMRIATNPYWCEGTPLAWQAEGGSPGIAFFALEGKVGHFNLAWWLMARTEPPQDPNVYKHTPLLWVILHAPKVLAGHYSLTDLASFLTLPEWRQQVARMENRAFQLAAHGVTYEMLRRL